MQVLERQAPARPAGEPLGGDEAPIWSLSADRVEFLTHVLVTACESGIRYWATCEDYSSSAPAISDRGVTITRVDGDHEWWKQTPDRLLDPQQWKSTRVRLADLARALTEDAGALEVANRRQLVAASRASDSTSFDANDCDAVFQVALFGALMYA